MTLATRTLRLHLLSVLGAPLAGAKVSLRLSSYQADEDDIVPLNWVLPEDPTKPGDYVAPVWPNTRNDGGTHYDMLVQASGQQLLTGILTVTVGAGESVHSAKINPPPYPPVYGAEKAVADANTFSDGAGESASRALAAVSTIEQVSEDYGTVSAAAAITAQNAATSQTANTSALEAADRSEMGAAASLAGGTTYTTTAQGLAATTNGQQFLLRTGDPQVYGVYLNNAGVAQYLGDLTLVGKGAIDAINKLITADGDPNGLVLPLFGDWRWLYGGFYKNGDLETQGFRIVCDHPEDGFVIKNRWGWVMLDSKRPSGASVVVPPWAGLNFLAVGDSITKTSNPAGGNFDDNLSDNWPTYFKPLMQVASFKNYAESGAAFREYGQTAWLKISHQIDQAIANNVQPDVLIVSAGTNDGIVSLGDFDTAMSRPTLADLDMSKTAEAMRYAFLKARTAWPNLKQCFYGLPLQRADVETSVRLPLLDLATKMAGRYDFHVMDAHRQSGILKDFEFWPVLPATTSPGRHLVDGLHTLPSGKVLQAQFYARCVRNVFNYNQL